MSKNKTLHFLIAYVVVLLISCNSENKEKIGSNSTYQNSSPKNQKYFVINNESMDIGRTEMIYISIEYWNGVSNVTLGVNDKIIDKRIKEIFPDSIKNIEDLPMGYIPTKIYLKQDALDYLSEYILQQCDTLIYERSYEDANTIFNIIISGSEHQVRCIYSEPKRLIVYFEGMLSWIDKYPERKAFEELVPTIQLWIENRKKGLEATGNN